MGTPIVQSQRDATQRQTVFLDYALVEYMNEEREFQIRLHGGKVERSVAARRSLPKPKNPDELVAKGLGPKKKV